VYHTRQFLTLQTPTGCVTIQFNSDTNYLELVQISQLKALVPQGCSLLETQAIVSGFLYFWPAGYKWGAPMTPFPGSIIFQNGSQNSGTHFTYCYKFLRKDTTQGQSNGSDAYSKVWKEEYGASMTSMGFQNSPGVPQPGSSLDPIIQALTGLLSQWTRGTHPSCHPGNQIEK
jgi:hypothetical protein